MRTSTFFAMLLMCHFAQAQSIYTPPTSSIGALEGVKFNGQSVGEKFKSRFSECDMKDTCDGKPLKFGCSIDRNRNSTLLKLNRATIFYDGKMGLDADGSPYSQRTPGKTDQPQTSLRYPLPGMPSINADRVPFIVIPQGGFDKALGVQVGDVSAVVFGANRVYAVVADQGPACKIGEGSIQLHEMLSHPVCKERASNGDCLKLWNVGIERDVLYFIFTGTRKDLYPGLTPENINARIEVIGAKAWQLLLVP